MTAVTSAWDEMPEMEFEVFAPAIINLNGGAASQAIMAVPTDVIWGGEDSGQYALIIKELIVVVTTAFAAAGVNNLTLGKSGAASSYHSYSTPNGSAVGTVLRVNQSQFSGEKRCLTTDKTIEIATTGALGAAGACRVGVRLSRRYSEWSGFTANRL